VTYIEPRKRKDGSVTYLVRWIDPDTKQCETLRAESEEHAKLLRAVLKAHGNNIDGALESVKAHYRGVYTVSRMIENHISHHGAPEDEYDSEMEDFAALITAGTPITPEVVATVWHKWFGDSQGNTDGEPEPATSGMEALAADLQVIQSGFVQY
jgi:hypothetical protein